MVFVIDVLQSRVVCLYICMCMYNVWYVFKWLSMSMFYMGWASLENNKTYYTESKKNK